MHESRSKADFICPLPDYLMDEYSAVEINPYVQKKLLNWAEQDVYVILTRFDGTSGAGPDLLPARMLRQGAEELAAPILRLALLTFESRELPESWREHWVAPVYKKKAVFTPANYRGVRLIAQLPKIIERLLLPLMLTHIHLWCLSAVNQFAYTEKR